MGSRGLNNTTALGSRVFVLEYIQKKVINKIPYPDQKGVGFKQAAFTWTAQLYSATLKTALQIAASAWKSTSLLISWGQFLSWNRLEVLGNSLQPEDSHPPRCNVNTEEKFVLKSPAKEHPVLYSQKSQPQEPHLVKKVSYHLLLFHPIFWTPQAPT